MSTRYLRRIQNQGNKINDTVIKATENTKTSVSSNANYDNDSDELTINSVNKKKLKYNEKSFNVFNVFSDLTVSVDDNDDSNSIYNDTDQYEKQEHEVNQRSTSSTVINCSNITGNKQKSKKKNRKKKLTSTTGDQCNREIDAECHEFSESYNLPCSSSDCQDLTACLIEKLSQNEILKVQQKYLNADNELKRLCGSKIISDNLGVNQRKNKLVGFNHSRCFRKMCLTESCKWSPSSSSVAMKNFGLSMTIDSIDPCNVTTDQECSIISNTHYFVYAHDNGYKDIQKKFFAAVESKNPQNIISILASHPYHVDSLIQFSEICKLNEDLQMSAEYIERALRCLEFSFHPSFNIIAGNCRLLYKKQTNRALFIALFRHLMFIAGRACYRTSLELCKVLLSFDPDSDPLACVLIIDWLSIRSKEYQWFINFCQIFNEEKHRNLTQLPNIAYSLALAHFYLQDHHDIADNLLQNALFMFPNVLSGLIEKCGIKPDKKVLNHNYFFNCNKIEKSKALKKLEDLYVTRSHHLWRDTNILAWLENNVHAVIDRIDSKQANENIKYCEIKRKKRYQGPLPRNISRHIILSDIKEVTLSYPESEDNIFSYDPLPPADSIDVYDNNTRLGTTDSVGINSSSNANFLSVFISSLFPTADRNDRIENLARIDNHPENEPDEFD